VGNGAFAGTPPTSGGPKKKTSIDEHAGESETSKMMITHPYLVQQDRAASESGADQHRENLPDGVYTGTLVVRTLSPSLCR
jgi:creatinine amidohydrolase